MTKNIFEELPARKHSPAAATPAAKKETGEGGSEKRIRQAVYDIRYRARREEIDLRAAYAQYMQNSNLSAPEQAAVRAKLFGKDGGGVKKESYDVIMSDGATKSVASAMFKVFVEKAEPVQEDATSDKKYKVRVTDKKSGRSYVRYADRAKITELRNKGLDVEMTEHGDPYEGNKKDRDGDGKVESSSKEHAGLVHNAIQRKMGGKPDGKDTRKESIEQVWEAFLADGAKIEAEKVAKKAAPVDNYKSSCVKVMPDMKEEAVSKAQQRFMGMVRAEQKGEMKNASPEVKEAAASMKKKDVKKYAETKHDGLPEKKGMMKEGMGGDCGPDDKKKEDMRDKRTYRELLKNKLRAMGMKNPMMLDAPEDPDKVMKIMTSSSAKMEETQQVDENLQDTVDKVTKAGQSALERMGVKINRTERGTPTKADQDAKIKQNKK
tara:strand:- start:298 stop:1602 length:1305 start_codon:yes stop_codon:yes gene_type:complete